jgi:hypothetical protein
MSGSEQHRGKFASDQTRSAADKDVHGEDFRF